ncbi:MAG: uracil-DNA glycosylase family protein [Caulobacterales bacterium]|nr:uracil-DNA glycosylase family protein [Caulobacterales bacterium]
MSCTASCDGAALRALVAEIRACRVCAEHLPHPPRPVVRLHPGARVAVVGQAPGVRVHEVGAPFVDPSGERLRDWMGIGEAVFYDPEKVAVAPVGFCFPGLNAKGGDLPPRRECAPLWQERVFALSPNVRLIVLAGAHAQKHHLGRAARGGLTGTVRAWRDFAPKYLPIPHPSWRNNGWIKKHPWFETELLPDLKARVAAALAG